MNKNLSDRAVEDVQLIRRAVEQNDQSAYTALMTRYREAVYHTMLKMVRNQDDAEDLTLITFEKAFRKLHTYTPTYAFSTWLFKIASNNGIDFLRKQRVQLLSIDAPADASDSATNLAKTLPTNALDPEERFIREQRQIIMRDLMQKLNAKYRHMIELRFFEEYSYQEIAERLDLPLGTVKAQLFRAKELLLEILNEDEAGRSMW